jgi:hypothetical protein
VGARVREAEVEELLRREAEHCPHQHHHSMRHDRRRRYRVPDQTFPTRWDLKEAIRVSHHFTRETGWTQLLGGDNQDPAPTRTVYPELKKEPPTP